MTDNNVTEKITEIINKLDVFEKLEKSSKMIFGIATFTFLTSVFCSFSYFNTIYLKNQISMLDVNIIKLNNKLVAIENDTSATKEMFDIMDFDHDEIIDNLTNIKFKLKNLYKLEALVYQLNNLEHLEKLTQLKKLTQLDQLKRLEQLDNLDMLNKLDSLNSLKYLDKFEAFNRSLLFNQKATITTSTSTSDFDDYLKKITEDNEHDELLNEHYDLLPCNNSNKLTGLFGIGSWK